MDSAVDTVEYRQLVRYRVVKRTFVSSGSSRSADKGLRGFEMRERNC